MILSSIVWTVDLVCAVSRLVESMGEAAVVVVISLLYFVLEVRHELGKYYSRISK
jgi:hypothetical protein